MKTLWVIIYVLCIKCCQITTAANDSGPFIPQSKQALAAASKQQQQQQKQHMDQQAQQTTQLQAQFKSDDIYNSDPYPPSANGPYPSADEDQYQDTAYESEPQPYSSGPTLENPSYDPNLYQNFVPQDSVQQYVSSYGGPYPESVDGSTGIDHPIGSATGIGDFGTGPGIVGGGTTGFAHGGVGASGFHGSGPGGFVPGGPVGFHGGGGPVGFPVGGPLPPPGGPFGPPFLGPPGFSIQSGYEGYLVPHFPPPPPPPPPPPNAFGHSSGAIEILKAFVPRSLMGLLMRSGSYLLNTIAVVLFGGAVTTAVCTFTPMCTISFAALPLLGLRDTAKTIKDKLSKEVTTDRVSRAAEFVKNAFDKYQRLQSTMNSKNSGDAVKLLTSTTPVVPSEISTTMKEKNKKVDTKSKEN